MTALIGILISLIVFSAVSAYFPFATEGLTYIQSMIQSAYEVYQTSYFHIFSAIPHTLWAWLLFVPLIILFVKVVRG